MSTKLTGYVWDGCAASGMKLSSVAIMARLADFSNDEGVCWPSIETIARQIGAGMSTVRTAIARLEAEGWLTRKARRQGMGIVLFRPGSELMPLFMQGRVLLEPEPERYSSFASGAVPAASQPLADDPAVRAVFRNEAVIRRAG
ncbi:helix-turn-helix domain-containing protein, partial [Escherichia coli]